MHCCGTSCVLRVDSRQLNSLAPGQKPILVRRRLSSRGDFACIVSSRSACGATTPRHTSGNSRCSLDRIISSHITSGNKVASSSSTDDSSSVQQWVLNTLATAGSSAPLRSTVVCLGVVAVLLAHGSAAHAAEGLQPPELHHLTAQPVFGNIAGEEDFWRNVGAYIRFFVTVMLGTANVVTKPFRDAAKSPATTAAVVLGCLVLFTFMTFTVKLMLGIGDDAENFEYLARGI